MGPEYIEPSDDPEYPNIYPRKMTCLECGMTFFFDEHREIPFCPGGSCRKTLAYYVWKLKEESCEVVI
jgi:hypothetical protein